MNLNLKQFAIIRSVLSDKRVIYVRQIGVNFELVQEFDRDCILTRNFADNFMRKPGLDPRYELIKLKLVREPVKKKVKK